MLDPETTRLLLPLRDLASAMRGLVARLLSALRLVALALFCALDVRDFAFKAVWFGSSSSYGLEAVGTATFDAAPLAANASLNLSSLSSGDEVDFASGWPSLLAKCDTLHVADGFFLHARATNCLLGVAGKQFRANDLFLASSARVDAVTWAACKLLYLHRRPPICQENVVTEFFHRYRLDDPMVPAEIMAEPNSNAEHELLDMLELIGGSFPLSSAVCFEGVQFGGVGEYSTPTLVGCASPNVYDAAFVGLHAVGFHDLHHDKSFLTVDVLNVMGFEFVIRQNSKSSFMISTLENDGRYRLEHRTNVNFTSFGHLYILLIAIDLVLLAAHVRSALETATVLLLPLLGTKNPEDLTRLASEYSWTILYRSLYRSLPIVALTLLSGVLSWQFQMPNSIIWTWNQQSSGKVFAVLSNIRVWMVVHCTINLLWGLAVRASETRAYNFVKRTFLTTFEVMIIGAIVAMLEQKRAFAISGDKYAIEGQRLWDSESFPGHTAYSNSFNEDLDYLLSTSSAVLRIVYSPMVAMVSEAMVVASVYLGIKFAVFAVRHRPDALVDYVEEEAEVAPPVVNELLPLEKLLRVPVRANSLIRSSFQLEIAAQKQLYIPPSVYFDFGVILDNDIIRTRRGFFNVIHLKVDVAKYFSPVGGVSKASVANMQSVAVPAGGLRRPSSLFGAAASSPVATRPPTSVRTPPRSLNGKSVLAAVVATDGVRADGKAAAAAKEDDEAKNRRSLAEAAGSPASRSMRRRKSTTELASLDDGIHS